MKRRDRRPDSASGPRPVECYWVGPEFIEADEGWLMHQATVIAENLKQTYAKEDMPAQHNRQQIFATIVADR